MWRRTIGYPLMMVLITALTAASLISVVKNVGQIVAGFKSLPAVNQVSHQVVYTKAGNNPHSIFTDDILILSQYFSKLSH